MKNFTLQNAWQRTSTMVSLLIVCYLLLANTIQAQNTACNAHFNHGPGNAINSVAFTSAINPAGTHYTWSFGDGLTSDNADPTHVYASPGTYWVCLNVVDTLQNGVICSDNWCDSVFVGVTALTCTAQFTFGAGTTVNGISFHSSANAVNTHYYWSFGDGTTSDNSNPTHSYATPGSYYVCLSVVDTLSSGICKDTWCDSVHINPQSPGTCTAHYTFTNGNLLNTVSFNDCQNVTGTHYSWNFGDGTTSDACSPSHTFASAGTYWVCLDVVDTTLNNICTDHWCDSIKVGVTAIICNAHYTFQITGNSVVFNGPTNPAGTHYYWTFGDGGSSAIASPTHAFASNGSYWVCLTVEDSVFCNDQWCDSIHIGANAITCSAHFTWGACNALNCVSFNSSPNPAGTHYSWTFGDGTTSDNPNPNHIYTSPGTYYVCLSVVDSAQNIAVCTNQWCDSIHIGTPPPPTCNAHFTSGPGPSVNSVSFHSNPNPTNTHYSWTFGDGGTSDNANPTHSYASPGSYYVCLTVIDTTSAGICTDNWCDSVHINPSPPLSCSAHFTSQPGNVVNGIHFQAPLNPVGTHYSWTFGDGGTSDNPSPTHQYANAGTYYVCLTVTDTMSSGICTNHWCDSVTIILSPPPPPNAACNAEFRYYFGSSPAHSVTFIAALNPPGTTYSWQFGDGGTSNFTNPVHVYSGAGAYHVCLTISRIMNIDTCNSTWCAWINVPLAPVHSSNGMEKMFNPDQASNAPSVIVYPNPMNEYTTVSLVNIGSAVSFRIFDSTGRLIYKKENIGEGNFTISNDNLRSGLYFYEVNSDSDIISKGKLIVQ